MFKKIISVILILSIFTLTGCTPILLLPQINKIEKNAEQYMNNYLSKQYEDFKIVDVEAFSRPEGFGHEISDMVKLLINIDSKEYEFYYNQNNNNVYSNYNYNTIANDLAEKVKKYKIPEDFEKTEIYIMVLDSTIGEIKTILHEDKTLNDVLNRIKTDNDSYSLCVNFYYIEKDDFTPYKIRIDTVFKEFETLNLNLYNVNQNYLTSKDKVDIIDIITYAADYENSEKVNLYVNVFHGGIKTVDKINFYYDDKYYDLKIEKRNAFFGDKTNEIAYNIIINTKEDKPPVYDEYLNEIGSKTIINRNRIGEFNVFFDKTENKKTIYLNNSDETHKLNLEKGQSKISIDFWLENIKEYKDIIVIYE